MASSSWNVSKVFPGAGHTATLGPEGIVVHPASNPAVMINATILRTPVIARFSS
jgi:N-acetylmuramoyl-L-alanine amidase CwlA